MATSPETPRGGMETTEPKELMSEAVGSKIETLDEALGNLEQAKLNIAEFSAEQLATSPKEQQRLNTVLEDAGLWEKFRYFIGNDEYRREANFVEVDGKLKKERGTTNEERQRVAEEILAENLAGWKAEGEAIVAQRLRIEKDEKSRDELVGIMGPEQAAKYQVDLEARADQEKQKLEVSQGKLNEGLVPFRDSLQVKESEINQMLESTEAILGDVKSDRQKYEAEIKAAEEKIKKIGRLELLDSEVKNQMTADLQMELRQAEIHREAFKSKQEQLEQRLGSLKNDKKETSKILDKLDDIGKTPAEIKKKREEKALAAKAAASSGANEVPAEAPIAPESAPASKVDLGSPSAESSDLNEDLAKALEEAEAAEDEAFVETMKLKVLEARTLKNVYDLLVLVDNFEKDHGGWNGINVKKIGESFNDFYILSKVKKLVGQGLEDYLKLIPNDYGFRQKVKEILIRNSKK